MLACLDKSFGPLPLRSGCKKNTKLGAFLEWNLHVAARWIASKICGRDCSKFEQRITVLVADPSTFSFLFLAAGVAKAALVINFRSEVYWQSQY